MADGGASILPEYLINRSTHTCLAVLSGTGVDDVVVGLARCSSSTRQQWFPNNGQWHWGGNRSLSLAKDDKTGGLCLAPCDEVASFWIHDEEGRFSLGSEALDVPHGNSRTKVVLHAKHGNLHQKWWTLTQLKEFLEEEGGGGDPVWEHCLPETLLKICKNELDRPPSELLGIDGTQEDYGRCQDDAKTVAPLGDGPQGLATGAPDYLISQDTHTCLTVLDSTCPGGDYTIGLTPYTGDKNQQWFVRDGVWHWGGDFSHCLTPDLNGNDLRLASISEVIGSWTLDKAGFFMNGLHALDVPWEEERTKVVLHPKHGGINQKWWMLSMLKSCVGRKMYPFPAKDTKVYEQELIKGIVNRLWPLSEPLPHPRDVVHYPGTVDETTPKVSMSCILSAGTVRQPENLRITVPKDWQATNMFVVAGCPFTITLPDTLTEEQAAQITIRVGAQCDCLHPTSSNVRNGTFNRMPVVSEELDVSPGVNRLRSQFGGNLIFTYEASDAFSITVEVENVIEAPHYILGHTDIVEWKRMKGLDAPFTVLETSKAVLIVPTSKARDISDVDDLLQRYDNVFQKLEDLSGFTEEDPPPQGKHWLVDDVQITAGSAHAGFPAMFNHYSYDLTSPETPHSWVVWHELGHNYQQAPYWSYVYGSETTVNLFSLYAEEKIMADDRLKRENRYVPVIKAVDDEALTFETADCWQKLVFLMEIKHAFPSHGWDMYRHLNRKVRSLTKDEAATLRSNHQRQIDFVYTTLSSYIGLDLLGHYQRWSLPISQKAQDEVESLKLPKAPQNLSVYCPATSDG